MPTIEITERTYGRLKLLTSPLFDYSAVIERLLDIAELGDPPAATPSRGSPQSPQPKDHKMTSAGSSTHAASSRAPRGECIDRETYARYLLAIITEWGGSARTRRIKPELQHRLRHLFSDLDLEHYEKNADQLRWWNHVRFTRQELVDRGLFVRGSAHGVWETTERGAELGRRLRADINDPTFVVLTSQG